MWSRKHEATKLQLSELVRLRLWHYSIFLDPSETGSTDLVPRGASRTPDKDNISFDINKFPALLRCIAVEHPV